MFGQKYDPVKAKERKGETHFVFDPSRKRRKPSTGAALGTLLALLVAVALLLSLGGWALMLALGIVGVSVSFWEGLAIVALVRLFVLPPTPSVGD